MRLPGRSLRQVGWLVCAALAAPLHYAGGQSRLVGYRTSSLGVVYENWNFSGGVAQPAWDRNGTVLIDHASQISFPLGVSVPVGQKWTVDLSAAYASSRVVLTGVDPELNTTRYTLSGLTDTRLRATGRLSSLISVTFGLNVPTGKTNLTPEEYSAFRVLAAPALSFQVPRLGNGLSGTAGVVASRQLSEAWAGALGVSYQVRGQYEPGALVAALSNPEYSPGDALRLSAGFDGLVGASRMTLGLSADIYSTSDEISDPAAGGAAITTKLGPVFSADWQLRLTAPRFRELTVYAVDRYRTRYSSGLASIGSGPVDESSGNYLDLGTRGIIAAGRGTGVLAAINFRHQTGLKSDDTIATAAMVSGGVTLGLVRDLGRGYSVQPFIRGQLGTIKSVDQSSTATGLGGGVALGRRF
jgi:hypothetical protein